MKKTTLTKLLGIVLIMALVMSMGIMAWAEGDDPATGDDPGTGGSTPAAASPDYSITVKNGVKDETYSAYKMFDLSVDDPTNPTAFRYTVNSAWSGFTNNAAFTAAFEVDSQGYITAKTAATSETEWVAGSVMSTLAEAAAKYAKDNNIAAKASVKATADGDVKLEVGEAGYYVIASTLGSRAMIETTPDSKAVTVNEKNEKDTIEKTVKEDSTGNYGESNDAQVGDTVEFKSVATIVPRSIKVKIHDTMDSGLTLNPSSIKVYSTYVGPDSEDNVEYTAATVRAGTGGSAPDTGDTFTIDIPDSFAATATASQTLTIIYTAEVNASAVVKDENGVAIVDQNNKTKVQFGDGTSSQEDTTTTTTHKFEVLKHAGGSSENLAGAIFQVKKGDAIVNLVKLDDNNYRVVDDTETTAAVSHVAENNEVATVAANTIVSDFVTVDSGNIVIWGVDSDSDYTITELQAPKGYNMLNPATKSVTVNSNNNTVVDVENNTGTELPSTGGIGTTIFYVVGSILVVAAGVLLITKKRMSREG